MARASYVKSASNVNGETVEKQAKYRLFNQPKVKNWSTLVDRNWLTELSNCRPGKMVKFIAAMSAEGMSWDDIPNAAILDSIFGVDAPVNYMGCLLGIDITTKTAHQDLVNKRRNLEQLEVSSPIEGLVATAVWVINPNSPPTGEDMVECIKAMRGQRNFCQVYYL